MVIDGSSFESKGLSSDEASSDTAAPSFRVSMEGTVRSYGTYSKEEAWKCCAFMGLMGQENEMLSEVKGAKHSLLPSHSSGNNYARRRQ